MDSIASKLKRKRGVVLTPNGTRKLQAAISSYERSENQGHRLTIEQLAQRIDVSTKTISRLWSVDKGVDRRTLQLCFKAFNLELNREDFRAILERDEIEIGDFSTENPGLPIENQWLYPDRPVPLDSPLYIARPPIEELVYREITQPGCVIRIRSAQQMGKTSLVLRLLEFAKSQGYRTVKIDCRQLEEQCLMDLNKLLRRLCSQIALELGIESNLDEQWDQDIGCKLSCSFYFQNYLLKQSKSPLVLVLSEIDRFFEYPAIADEFFPLLRSWCDEAGHDRDWQNLRLVVVYSTEEYISLDINRSPFNIGLPIHLHEFTEQQVEELAVRYGLEWTPGQESQRLMSLVGGHPALIQIALFYLKSGNISLEKLIAAALANGGIYRHHLWQHWLKLQVNPSLLQAYTKLVTEEDGSIEPVDAYKLDSLGLVSFENDRLRPRCQLYRNYFAKQIATIFPRNSFQT